jgi:hypothetical protein
MVRNHAELIHESKLAEGGAPKREDASQVYDLQQVAEDIVTGLPVPDPATEAVLDLHEM